MVLYQVPECLVKKVGLLCSRSRSRSWWNFKILKNVCPDNLFRTTESFISKLILVGHQKPECPLKGLVSCLQGQGHSKNFIWSNDDSLLCLLNCWSLCNQNWFDGIGWIVFCKDWVILLCSSSRSQQRLNISVNVHLDIFLTAEPFVTKLGMVMHHHGPECHAKRLVYYFKVKVTVKAPVIRYDCFYHSYWYFCNQIYLDCCLQGQGQSKGSKLYWIFICLVFSVPLISSNQTSCVYVLLIITKPKVDIYWQ